MSGILGKKIGMSQVFSDDGKIVPVTYVVCAPNSVFQLKTQDKDGYDAVVLGYEKLKKPLKTKKFRVLREFLFADSVSVGDSVSVDSFSAGDKVVVRGVSKGKGFQGPVRRHNFRVQRKTHGVKEGRHGSTGQCAAPGRTKAGTKMAGRMGGQRVTLKGCEVIMVDSSRDLIAIKGCVPGAVNALVSIEK